jgi:AcrR family transcriptional regulator
MLAASQTRSKAPKRRAYRMVARAEATAATRARLLEAAWRQFADHPFEETRLADVARDAQVSLPTLHSHFGTKDKLFVAAWRWRMTPEAARRDATPPGDVQAAVRTLYTSYEQDGDAVLRLFAQEDRIPAVHEMLDDGRRAHRAWVERALGELVGGLRGPERERRMVSLVVATDLLVWKLLRREMGLGRRAAERIVTEMVARAREGA